VGGSVFLDTNILVYAIETGGPEPEKHAVALTLARRDDVCLSTQVLGEFYAAGRHRVGYYDALILAAAHLAECSVVFSEDLSTGQDYSGVRIDNPFSGGRSILRGRPWWPAEAAGARLHSC
jgi:predicted nucleic acid-binding protein